MQPADREEALFAAALEKPTPAERAAYLDGACGNDHVLRARIEALLAAHAASGGVLDAPPDSLTSTGGYLPLTEGPGTVIGRYKLLQQIGEGGMGVVYMAEQQEPVRRKIALKIIKPGMDSRQVIARFEAERQALALMDHQNIARVLDAGTIGLASVEPSGRRDDADTRRADATTLAGRPYFVMELVHGVKITKFCDDHKLTPRERLRLFIPVCQAIQHAHQKGIIHRDIKPSNVLVTMYDDKPVPKVIDFGVAKAVEQRLTEKTMYAVRRPGRHLRVHEPRAGGDERLRRGHAQRRVLAGRGAVRAVDRDDAAGGPAPARGGPGRDAAPDQGGGSAAAEQEAEQLEQPAEDRGRARHRAGPAVEVGPRRDRLDRDEVPGAPLRHGQRPGPRRGAVFGRRAGGGVSAECAVSAEQVRPQA
jgi:hypothetical protein